MVRDVRLDKRVYVGLRRPQVASAFNAFKAGVRRIAMASSSSVYGDTPTLPKGGYGFRSFLPLLIVSPACNEEEATLWCVEGPRT